MLLTLSACQHCCNELNDTPGEPPEGLQRHQGRSVAPTLVLHRQQSTYQHTMEGIAARLAHCEVHNRSHIACAQS